MAKSTTTASEDDLGPLMRALVIIEKLGNKLPHPFWLFLGLAVIVMFVSAICAAAGVSAVNPASGETVAVSNLFSTENLRAVVGGVVTNYVEFPHSAWCWWCSSVWLWQNVPGCSRWSCAAHSVRPLRGG